MLIALATLGRSSRNRGPMWHRFTLRMASRDDALVDLFIPVINTRLGTSYVLTERPDEVVRDRPEIEAIASDTASGHVLRIEHTRLEPFEGEVADYGRLRDIAEAIEADDAIRREGRDVDVTFAVGAFEVFPKWGRDKHRVLAAIIEWLRSNAPSLPIGYREHELALPEKLVVGVDVEEFDGAGKVFVGRRDAPAGLDASIRRAVSRKLPKLLSDAATTHVLLLEKYVPFPSRDDIGSAISRFTEDAPELARVEVWIADTNGWHADATVGFYRVWPAVDRSTSWIRGVTEVRLLHKRHLMQREEPAAAPPPIAADAKTSP